MVYSGVKGGEQNFTPLRTDQARDTNLFLKLYGTAWRVFIREHDGEKPATLASLPAGYAVLFCVCLYYIPIFQHHAEVFS